jgi:pimeloyl-ACP methyl ester carboxylesterase
MKEWKSGYVKSNGNDLFYARTGGDKKPLLLAHGHTDDGACWTEFAKLLEDDYDVIMYDAIGHGNSARLKPGMEIDLGNDMKNLVEGLGLKKPAIWGHSMGAGTTVDYANNHAKDIRAIILEDTGWFDGDDTKLTSALALKPYKIADLQKGTMEEAIELSKKIHPRHKDSIHPYWASSKMKYDVAWVDRKFTPTKYPWRELGPNLTCPTLLLTAENEKGGLMTPEVAVAALGILPNAQWAYFPNAGHTIRYEQFDLVMGVVKNFLRHHYPA